VPVRRGDQAAGGQVLAAAVHDLGDLHVAHGQDGVPAGSGAGQEDAQLGVPPGGEGGIGALHVGQLRAGGEAAVEGPDRCAAHGHLGQGCLEERGLVGGPQPE
jgi:hypothetical protein